MLASMIFQPFVQALSTGERKKAGPTAPPEGLVLVEIREVP